MLEIPRRIFLAAGPIAAANQVTHAPAHSGAWSTDQPISVMDFVPAALHAGIRDRTDRSDLTSYFQAAVAAAGGASINEEQPVGAVFIPNGLYHISRVGIRGVVLRGESRTGTVLKAVAKGGPSDFMLDAMLDRDGVGLNTTGAGWADTLSIDGDNSGRSALRLYGGGGEPRQLDIRNAAVGLSYGLPMWCRIANIIARDCDVGFETFHPSPQGAGTSTIFEACWALDCRLYGFRIQQIYYSSFLNCVSQNAGRCNFLVDGGGAGTALYSLQFIGCATEGRGQPFEFRKCRELTIIAPRIIDPPSEVHFIVLDDAYGTIIDYSTVKTPDPGFFHVDGSKNAATGDVILVGGSASFAREFALAFSCLAAPTDREGLRAVSAGEFHVGSDRVIGRRDTGWAPATGPASKTAFTAAPAGRAGREYDRSQLQGALDRIAALEARLVAYDAAFVRHGLIGL